MKTVVLAGGGVIGYSCGWALARFGLQVQLVDDDQPGATPIAAGTLIPATSEAARGPLGQLNRRAMRAWNGWEPARGLVLPGGMLRAQGAEAPGLAGQWLEPQQLRRRVPGLVGIEGATWYPQVGYLDAQRLLPVLRGALLALQPQAVVQGRVRSLLRRDGRAVGVQLEGGRQLAADVVVGASGLSWSWLPAGLRPRLQAQIGERVLLQLQQPVLESVLVTPEGTLVPLPGNRLWAGVTARTGEDQAQPTLGGSVEVMQHALHYLPQLASSRVLELGAGLRPLSRDGMPWVGPTALPGLLLAAGHGRHGLLQAPLAAQAILACVRRGQLPAWSRGTDPRQRPCARRAGGV